jgi:DNA invertase Pin-like site-specific DNA recombinase
VNLALAIGLRGLPGQSSLYTLLKAERDIPGHESAGQLSPLRYQRGRPPNDRRRRRIQMLRQMGLSIVAIAKELGCTRQNVSATLFKIANAK